MTEPVHFSMPESDGIKAAEQALAAAQEAKLTEGSIPQAVVVLREIGLAQMTTAGAAEAFEHAAAQGVEFSLPRAQRYLAIRARFEPKEFTTTQQFARGFSAGAINAARRNALVARRRREAIGRVLGGTVSIPAVELPLKRNDHYDR
ncbi:MAG: hypothetical protein JWN38_1066 [Candidatus Saccharibacteria bacterium]|nr:hypothetical protein [Candidatus Saccharibacteria bacterium]